MWRVVIDEQAVELEPVGDESGKTRALLLVGPGVYNGHLHGDLVGGGAVYCLPNVVDSEAKPGQPYCDRVPSGSVWHEDPYMVAVWVKEETNALL